VKWYYGPDGNQSLWFEPDEIEAIAEDELGKAGLMPTQGAPVTDLERFVEQHLHATLDQYAELDGGVLGQTSFIAGEVPAVAISADLTGSALDDEDAQPGLRGRWRATLAHEASHVLLHRFLFATDLNQGQLFTPPDVTASRPQGLMRCLKRDVGYANRTGDWREVQANRGMAALLMPRKVFKEAASVQKSEFSLTTPTSSSAPALLLAQKLGEIFAVSRQAASIRLETLRIVVPIGTSTLTM